MDETTRALLIARARTWARSGEGRRRREEAQLSIRDVGRAIGLSNVTIHRWETQQNLPSGDSAVRWVELLDQLEAVAR